MKRKNEIDKLLTRIDKVYDEIFNKQQMEKLIKLIWGRIREKFERLPAYSDLIYRIIMEEIMIYGIILGDEKGYAINRKIIINEIPNMKIESYGYFLKYYEEPINVARQYFERNPIRKRKFLVE